MPRKDTAAQDALTILAILRRIPRSHWITTTELQQLPATLVRSLDYLFEEARHSLNEAGATSRATSWMKKVDIVPDSVPMMPPNIKPRLFEAVSEALYRDAKLEIDYVNHLSESKHAVVSPLGLV